MKQALHPKKRTTTPLQESQSTTTTTRGKRVTRNIQVQLSRPFDDPPSAPPESAQSARERRAQARHARSPGRIGRSRRRRNSRRYPDAVGNEEDDEDENENEDEDEDGWEIPPVEWLNDTSIDQSTLGTVQDHDTDDVQKESPPCPASKQSFEKAPKKYEEQKEESDDVEMGDPPQQLQELQDFQDHPRTTKHPGRSDEASDHRQHDEDQAPIAVETMDENAAPALPEGEEEVSVTATKVPTKSDHSPTSNDRN